MSVCSFPLRSVTVHVTVVLPTGNTTGASLITEATPQLSLVVAEPSTTDVDSHTPPSAVILISLGAVIVGRISSSTVTVEVQVETFPWISVTVNVTTGDTPTALTK